MAKTNKPERDLTINEVRQALAIGLRDKVVAVAEKFKDLKQREVQKVQKLGKHELCLLCGNLDKAGSCTCLTLSKSEGVFKFQKNALMGYDDGQAGGASPGAGADMAMAEMDKSEMCKGCGQMSKEEKPDHKFEGKGKKLESDVKTCKVCGKPYDSHMKKEEITENKFEKCKTCDSVHKIGVSYDHALVKENNDVPTDDPLNPDAVLPDDKKVKEPDETGSGGEDSKLQKDAMGALMGKEKFAKPGSMGAPKLPGMTAPKVNGMHPETQASLQGIKSMSPVVNANAQMSKFKSLASNPTAMPGGTLVNPKAMTGRAVSGEIKGKPPVTTAMPAPLQNVRNQANQAATGLPGSLQNVRNQANLAADKKAGGVGWLNSLISRFKGPDKSAAIKDQILRKPGGGTPVQAAPVQSVRFHGARPLVRSESFETDLKKSMGNCIFCNKLEHLGSC